MLYVAMFAFVCSSHINEPAPSLRCLLPLRLCVRFAFALAFAFAFGFAFKLVGAERVTIFVARGTGFSRALVCPAEDEFNGSLTLEPSSSGSNHSRRSSHASSHASRSDHSGGSGGGMGTVMEAGRVEDFPSILSLSEVPVSDSILAAVMAGVEPVLIPDVAAMSNFDHEISTRLDQTPVCAVYAPLILPALGARTEPETIGVIMAINKRNRETFSRARRLRGQNEHASRRHDHHDHRHHARAATRGDFNALDNPDTSNTSDTLDTALQKLTQLEAEAGSAGRSGGGGGSSSMSSASAFGTTSALRSGTDASNGANGAGDAGGAGGTNGERHMFSQKDVDILGMFGRSVGQSLSSVLAFDKERGTAHKAADTMEHALRTQQNMKRRMTKQVNRFSYLTNLTLNTMVQFELKAPFTVKDRDCT